MRNVQLCNCFNIEYISMFFVRSQQIYETKITVVYLRFSSREKVFCILAPGVDDISSDAIH